MRSMLLGCTCLAASVAVAVAAPETRPAGELVREWGERFRASVRSEPGVEEVPVAASASTNMERSLNGLKRAAPALSWARWGAEGEVDDAEIGMLGRAQSRITGAWMAVSRPKSATLRAFQELEKRDRLAQYVVFAAEEETGRRLGDRLTDLQRQQAALAGEGDAAAAYGGMMSLLAQMPPAEAQKFAGATVVAGNRVWDATPPEQRQALLSETRTLISGALQKAGNRAPAVPRAPSQGYPAELLSAVRALAGEEQATILADPGVFAPDRTRLPERGPGLEVRLTELVRQHPGVVWRRVYVPERQLARLKKTGATAALVQAVRSLDGLETESIDLEDPTSGRQVRFERRQPQDGKDPAESLPPEIRAFYLVLSATPFARGRTQEERLLDLQRQQVGLMLRMSSDQMAAAMGPLVAGYGAAGPEERRRLIGLPLMAGMMAAWMPRHAKESAE